MKKYWGIGVAIFLSGLLLSIELIDWLMPIVPPLKHDIGDWCLSIIISLILMFVINIGSIINQHRSEKAEATAKRLYNSIQTGVRPLVRESLIEKIKISGDSIRQKYSRNDLQFFVFVFEKDAWQVIASTQPETSQTWSIVLGNDEGVIGFTAQKKAEFLTKITSDGQGIIVDKHDEQLGDPKKLSKENRSRTDENILFIFSSPILGQTTSKSLTKEFLGVLSVDSYTSDGENLMKQKDLRQSILNLGGELAPYLGVLAEIQKTNDESRQANEY